MNAANPSIDSALPSLPPLPAIAAGQPVHLPRLLLGMLLAIALFDFCFWGVTAMGFSVAVFFPALAAVILSQREFDRCPRTVWWMILLLAGAAGQAVMETGVTNTLVFLSLIVALAGDSFFNDVDTVWGRWLAQIAALIASPGRPFWLAARLLEATVGKGFGWTGGLIGRCLLAIPALVLTVIFGALLASGNAIFSHWTNSFFDWFWTELALYLNPVRIIVWSGVALMALPLLRPARLPCGWWAWIEDLSPLRQIIPTRGAIFSSGLILVVLNVLFFVANLADALFLWSGEALPAGVTYSGFVHSGVNALIGTALLSAFVITALFQQERNVARRPALKWLAFLWIAQNLFLLASVALRLKLYIEAYDMTVLRLGVLIFIALVAAGYVLLTIKIAQDRSLSWLLGGCVLAVFATFYITQFLNLAGWSADYNVARWEKNRARTLDTGYLYSLGAPAWPALSHAHELDNAIPVINDEENRGPLNRSDLDHAQFDGNHWREFSLRAWLNRNALK